MKNTKRVLSYLLIFVFLFNAFLAGSNIHISFAESKVARIEKDKVQLIVKYNDNSSIEAARTSIANSQDASVKFKTVKKYTQRKIDILEIEAGMDINKAITKLKSNKNVKYVVKNNRVKVYSDPSDTKFVEQWGLKNSGQTVAFSQGITGIDIDVSRAWESLANPATVLVGVLDTGIDINHEDLKGSIFVNTSEFPDNNIDDDGNGYIDDIYGWDFANNDATVFDNSNDQHGTHVAGIIGAQQNSKGIAGIASNAKILPLKFIHDGIGYISDAIEAIEYAKDMGVKVMNASFGCADNNPALQEAIADSGILFVCAAGNDGVNNTLVYPASYNLSNIISVASINNKGLLSSFSNYGSTVDIAAPGEGIISTLPNNSYGFQSGTSMATAFVSGVASLVKGVMTDLDDSQLSLRIVNSASLLAALKGKVSSNGSLNAYNSLTDSTLVTPPTLGSENNSNTPAVSPDKTVVRTLAATITPELQEQIHYGEEGVNVSTGNYSKQYVDMSMSSPGFTINISRTYNSKDERSSSSMGRGWTFGFEGSLKQDTTNSNLWIAKLPDGSASVFVKNADGTYEANDSRSKLIKNTDGTHTLTTKDQYTYGFSANGYLSWMKDKVGNSITISVDATGEISYISDQVGRQFKIDYSGSYISKITDPMGRTVVYTYTNGLLKTVQDPNNYITSQYEYDTSNYLTCIKDYYGNPAATIVYNHSDGSHKVQTYKDAYGNTDTYQYDTTNRATTITDTNNRVIKKWYDEALYVIKSQDPEGKISTVEYYKDSGGFNKYGEEKIFTDRDGNITQYARDDRGNITKITNPDTSFREYRYDIKNNEIWEKDETGKVTYFIYDSNMALLLKKVQPLNGTDEYSSTLDQSRYAITSYLYYSDTEALQLGYKAKGLLKTEIDPEGNALSYTYDEQGNKTSVTDSAGSSQKYVYNSIGWITSTTTPEGRKTAYGYDNLQRIIREIKPNGEVTRTVYDPMGRKTQEIQPSQYNPGWESQTDYTYKDNSVGTRYDYYPNGLVKYEITPKGERTEYIYDKYGNLEKKTMPNGVEYSYTYDCMNRIQKEYVSEVGVTPKPTPTSSSIILKEYAYSILPNGNSSTTVRSYASDTDYAEATTITDYADRVVEVINADGTKKSFSYNPNGTLASSTNERGATTYYNYDGLNRHTETWSPIEPGKYMYSATRYFKNDLVKEELSGKDMVELYFVPMADRLAKKNYTYYPDGTLKTISDSTGAKTSYRYDRDKNKTAQYTYITDTQYNTIEYTYNNNGQLASEKIHVAAGDIYGNSITSRVDKILETRYAYDINGNLSKKTLPNGTWEQYGYDLNNRNTDILKQDYDETGRLVTIRESTSYNWDGTVASKSDADGNTNYYSYDKLGNLVKVINPMGGVTFSGYDRMSRKMFDVSPNNYLSNVGDDPALMSRTEYTYGKMNRLSYKTEKNVRTTPGAIAYDFISAAYQYDACGNVVKQLDGEGIKAGTGSTIFEKIVSGYGTEIRYNLANMQVSTLDPVSKERGLSYTTFYQYDGIGRKISESNAGGEVATYYYDDAGRLISAGIRDNGVGLERTLKTKTYDLAGNAIIQTDGNGNTTTLDYNAFGKVRSTKTASDESIPSYTQNLQYDVSGLLKYSIDNMGKANLLEYDNSGRVTKTTEQDKTGQNKVTTTTRYDLTGNKRFVTDPNGIVTEYIYNTLNQLTDTVIIVTDVNNGKTMRMLHTDYDLNGNKIREYTLLSKLPAGDSLSTGAISIKYDSLNRIVEKSDATNVIETISYNCANVQISSLGANSNETKFAYDRNNRLIKTTDPLGHTTEQTWDNEGRLASKIDGNGNTTKYEYDLLGNIQSVTNALGEVTSYSYDLSGNMLSQTDGNGNTQLFEYNVINKLIRKIDACGREGLPGAYTYKSGKVETYTYYPNGLMATKLDRNGKKTVYSYDVHGRLLSEAIDGNKKSYYYDRNGNQVIVSDNIETISRTFDELNRVKTKSVKYLGASQYLYDIIDLGKNLVGEENKDPRGNTTRTWYDQNGRMASVESGNVITQYSYNSNGSRQSVIYSNGTTDIAKEVYEYNADNTLKKLTNFKNTTIYETFEYTYDNAKNQLTKTDRNGKTSYTYDSLNRLETVTEPTGKSTAYSFDKAGNRLVEYVTISGSVTRTDYAYNEQNRLTSTSTLKTDGIKETITFSYDNNGNLTRQTVESIRKIDPTNPPPPKFGIIIPGQGTTENAAPVVAGMAFYEYDVWNQMIKSTNANSTSTFRYNAEGLRVETNANGEITRYLYEGDKVVLELDGKGQNPVRTIEGLNVIARIIGEQTAFYLYNGHGDVTTLISASGEVLAYYNYDAFGNPIKDSTQFGTFKNPFRYAGYQYDEKTSLYYLNARMYDPRIARFMQEDTYGRTANDPLSLNLYTYCSNNPIIYFDPSGHAAANVTVGNVPVGNAQVNNGVTTGNLRDIVSGLGGTVAAANSGIYIITMPNGATATIDTKNHVLKDSSGNVIGNFTIVNGNSQVSVRQMAQLAGVADTISYHKDTNGIHTVAVSPVPQNSNTPVLLGLGTHNVVSLNSANPYDVQKGIFNDTVRDAQICLISMNYNVGGADGLLGPKTAEKIKEFQKKYGSRYGLAPTGQLDESTLKALQKEAKDDIIARDKEWKSIIEESNSVLSKTAYKLADPLYFLNYNIQSQDSIDPIFAGRLAQLAKDFNTTIDIISGNRTFEEQEVLYQKWLDGTGDFAAKPGESRHNYGEAIDLWKYHGSKWEMLRYLDYYVESIDEQTTLLKYGLIKPLYYGSSSDPKKWEAWHVQPVETRGKSVNELKLFLDYLK